MADHRSVRLEKQQIEAIEEMANSGLADNESEAHRSALNAGLTHYGVLNGSSRDTPLRATARRFADAFALLGIMWFGLSFWFPIELRMYAVAPFVMAAACMALDRALKTYEPALTRRLGELVGRKA